MLPDATDLKGSDLKRHREKFGRADKGPRNLKVIEASTFSARLCLYEPVLTERRKLKSGIVYVLWFFARGEGVGIRQKSDGCTEFIEFSACLHPRAQMKTVGRCLSRYTCSDCGAVWEVDSSD